ncbi:hypothetical protein [Actinomadura litoris]|uniref:Uncharacterized protein n=1 Tax=Actinomadura litoris TaxID=2678616 RepID=A0A7K1LAX7_9ACTN|nr:hypothetical protein [Actinomadura litoris]MUN41396.1 hypothetical protein [Actinomadura litoris]
MARHKFGQSSADWTFEVGPGDIPVLASGVELTAWSAVTGGTQYTDLLDSGGGAITIITSGDGGTYPEGTIPEFSGPDGITALWVEGGVGTRYKLTATDLGDTLDGKLDLAGGSMEGELRLSDDSPAASQDYVLAHASGGAPSILPFSYTGILSVRTGTGRIYNDTGRALTIGTVRASAATGPAGQSLIIDVHKSGTTIYTTQANRPTIAAGQVTGTGGVPDVATWAAGEYLTVDIDQVGTTTPGSDLTVTIPST